MAEPVHQAGEWDVIIIGAGFAGLAAADRLNRLNVERVESGRPALRYVVLEGAKRAGGRTMTKLTNDIYLDFGGQYLAPKEIDPQMGGFPQCAAYELVERFRVEVFDTYLPDDKDHVYQAGTGATLPFRGNFPMEGAPEVVKLLGQVEALVKQMQSFVGKPWEFPGAAELDALSISQWLDREVPDPAMRELFDIAVRSAFSVEPDKCSLLHFLHYAGSCGSFAAFENVKGGGDAVRFRFGTGDLINKLADSAAQIAYRTKVLQIRRSGELAVVRTQGADGEMSDWRTQRVIMAMSPTASAKISYDPPLSAARQELIKGMPMAHTIKGFAIFNTTWWREKFSGYVLSAQGPIDWVMDNTWVDSNGEFGQACLMTFIVGQQAIDWGNGRKTPDDRKRAVLDQLAVLFNVTRELIDAELVRYEDFDWSQDEWGKGCPAGCLKPMVLTKMLDGQPVGKALYEPVGLVHWAGSETGLRWMGGYMNGAIDSGIRVADEVAALL